MALQLGIKALPETFFGQNLNDGQVQLVLGVPIETDFFDWDNRPDDIMPVEEAIDNGLLLQFYNNVDLADPGIQAAISSDLFQKYYAPAVSCINSDGSTNPDAVIPDYVLGFAEIEVFWSGPDLLGIELITDVWYGDTVNPGQLY